MFTSTVLAQAFASVLFSSVLCSAASSEPDQTLCGQFDSVESSSSAYSFNVNAWGADNSGAECITVSNDDTVFSSTWSWTNASDLVHAFPNIQLESTLLPIQLSGLTSLNIGATWAMAASGGGVQTLASIDAGADVVVDMFMDLDPIKANSTTLPANEVMVWIGAFGGKMPIGFNASITNLPTFTLNGTEFTLYSGPNGAGQFVYSWLASSNVTTFNSDISPLLHYLTGNNMISNSSYLGIVQFGTETFHAESNVTFTAQNFAMSINSAKAKKSAASGPILPSLSVALLLACSGVMLAL